MVFTYKEFRQNKLRASVASDLAGLLGLDYGTVLRILEQHKTFSSWDIEETWNRPVNIEELADLVLEEVN